MPIIEAARVRVNPSKNRKAKTPSDAVRKGRFRWSLIALNFPFMVGTLIVLFLLAVVLFGPRFASENPYLSGQRAAEMVNGELIFPPFSPSPQFPLGSDQWGRDVLSMFLYGARNTLVACLFVTMARLALGLVLGALAGWKAGGLVDRAVMGLVGVLSSLPTLLTGMILIFALDVRKGLSSFLIALCLVGWGEIAQYIRSEFISLREQPFVEGARVIGLTEGGIMVRHVLPNVLPSLVVLTLLEMGSVLVILGELGFVGVFIGGGIQTGAYDDSTIAFAGIPEWGAMLSGARAYIRSSPWMVFYPAMAFFVAVLGFNLLGEGLRRIIREAGVNTAALVSKRLIMVVAAITLVTWYITNQIAPGVSYAKLASQFDAGQALEHVHTIVELQQDDPGFGTDGALRAAEYIAARFEAYGALPAARGQNYLQPVTRRAARRITTPELAATGEDGTESIALVHGADFGEQVYRHGGSGSADGALVFVGFSKTDYEYRDFRGLDLRGQVALVLGDNIPTAFDNEALIRGALAILVITDDAVPHIDFVRAGGDFMENPTFPILHVRPEAADRLLELGGYCVADLRTLVNDLRASASEQGWCAAPMGIRVSASVELSAPEEITGYNVLAILPGSDTTLDKEALLISTHYDMPEPDPDRSFLAASDGPAGVGIILEMARLWQVEDFKPRRTVLFGVWAGGYLSVSGANTYKAESTPYRSLDRNAVVHLGSVGSGEEVLLLNRESNSVVSLLERSGGTVGVSIQQQSMLPHAYCKEIDTNSAIVAWELAPDPFCGDDTLENLSLERLRRVGEIVNLALITASRQYHY
ncbi:MAG: ABC transporter permease subunit [Chloroflexota bacterium]